MRVCIATLTLAALLGAPVLCGAQDDQAKADRAPNFVFSGTVEKLNASNVPQVKGSDRTVVVTVDEVHSDVPKAMAGMKGRQVTVELSKPLDESPLKVGQKMTFSTQGRVYGETIAVREVGERSEPGQTRALAPPGGAALSKQLAQASAVVTGTVEEIRPVSSARIMAEAKGERGVAPAPRAISEHDPMWHAAVIKVDTVEKGAPGKRVIVVFPQSRDIAWRRAPKYAKDQKGTWMLQKQQIANPAVRTHVMTAAASVANTEVQNIYTALDPRDFIPAHDATGDTLDRLRTMIKKNQ